MKFYIKDKNDTFVEATQDQILDGKINLYNEEKEVIRSQKPDPNTDTNYMDELTKTVKEMALAVGDLSDIKAKQDEFETKINKYQEAADKGFPISIPDGNGDSGDDLYAPYDLAIQGKGLMDRISHPGYELKEDRRQEMAKYFVLFLKAAYFQNPVAKAKFIQDYGTASRDPNQKTALGDTGNVFPVPDIVDSEIIHFAREKSVVLQECRIWPMTSDKESIPTETGGVSVAWGNTTSESDPTISETELSATELSAYSAVRNTTLADSRSDIVSWLTELMSEAAGQELDNESFNGDGSDVCSGLFSKAGYTVTAASALFSSVTADNWSEMLKNLDGLKKENAKFYMNGAIIHYVRVLKDSQDRPIFMETVGSPVSGKVYGFPYREVVKCNSTDGASKNVALFGNLRYFAIGRRLDATTLQVDPYGLFTTNRTRFKLYQRWGLQVALANAFVKLITAAS